MKIDTEVAVNAAANQLSRFIERVDRDTVEIVREANLSKTIGYFYELREAVRSLQKQTAELQNHLNSLSHNLIPKMFLNANVKTLMVPGVGNATITVAWSAKVLNKKRAFEWLHATGNDGLIIETINCRHTRSVRQKSNARRRAVPPQRYFPSWIHALCHHQNVRRRLRRGFRRHRESRCVTPSNPTSN